MKKIKVIVVLAMVSIIFLTSLSWAQVIPTPFFGPDSCFLRVCKDGSQPYRRAFREVLVDCLLDEQGMCMKGQGGLEYAIYTCQGGESWECFWSAWVEE